MDRGTGEGDGRRIVIGVGNPYRCDDGAGLVAARRIAARESSLRVVEASGEGASLMETWSADDEVVLIDAVRSKSSPGRIHRLDACCDPIPSEFFHYSTHAFGVAEAVEMARVIDTLPRRLVIYGIEGKSFAAGTELSPEVERAVESIVDRVRAEFHRLPLDVCAGRRA